MEAQSRPDRHILNVPEMDLQHQYLYSLFDRIEDNATVSNKEETARLLKEIEGYLLFHFNSEEHLIRLYGAPGFAAHQTEHEQAGGRLVGFLEDFESGSLNPARLRFVLSNWLAEHALLCDEQYAKVIRKIRGIA